MRILRSAIVVLGLVVPNWALAGQIVVTGQGTVESVPDMAVISVGARYEAATAREALNEVNRRTEAMLKVMRDLGVAEKDLQTGGLFLNPVWERNISRHERARITGYEAGNRVRVKIRDLAILGQALDRSVSGGANTFNGLQFAVQEPKPLMDEARRRAVADARARAELLAEAADVELGALISLTEGSRRAPEPVMMARMEMAADASVPVAPGEVSTSATVTLVYEIAE